MAVREAWRFLQKRLAKVSDECLVWFFMLSDDRHGPN